MKNYIVKLEMNISGYEKIAVHRVAAVNERDAMKQALTDECHNTPDFDDENETCLDDYMRYTVLDCVQITEHEASVLNRVGL